MRTNLYGTSNAVLTLNGEFVAIIGCPKSGDITKKIEQAVRDHFPDSVVALIKTDEILNNTTPVTISMEIIQDQEQPFYRDFELKIVPTY